MLGSESGLTYLLAECADSKGFVKEVNQELERLWQEQNGYDPDAAARIAEIEKKVRNIRNALEDGLSDTGWANNRLSDFLGEQRELEAQTELTEEAPQIDTAGARRFWKEAKESLLNDTPERKKKLLRQCVAEIELAPEQLEVEITYSLPEPVMNGVVAGARSVPEKKTCSYHLVSRAEGAEPIYRYLMSA